MTGWTARELAAYRRAVQLLRDGPATRQLGLAVLKGAPLVLYDRLPARVTACGIRIACLVLLECLADNDSDLLHEWVELQPTRALEIDDDARIDLVIDALR